MNKVVVILSLVVFFYSISSTSTDIKKIKTQFIEKVAIPYLFAIQLFADDILKPLADIPVPENFGKREYEHLNSTVNDFYDLLKVVETELKKLVDETNLEIEYLVANQSGVRKTLTALRTERRKLIAEKNQLMTNFLEAYKKVVRADYTLRNFSETWGEDKRKLDKAINCTGHRRKRPVTVLSWLHTVDAGETEIVPEDLNKFSKNVTNLWCKLKKLDADKEQLRFTIIELRQKKETIDDNVRSIENSLKTLRKILKKVVDASKPLKQVRAHISTLKAKSKILRNEVEWLIDMNNLIVPLQSVSDQIKAFVGENLPGFKPYATIHSSIRSSIEKIKVNLPKYPWIEN